MPIEHFDKSERRQRTAFPGFGRSDAPGARLYGSLRVEPRRALYGVHTESGAGGGVGTQLIENREKKVEDGESKMENHVRIS